MSYYVRGKNSKKVAWPTGIIVGDDFVRVKIISISEMGIIIETNERLTLNQSIKLLSKALINGQKINFICDAIVSLVALSKNGYKVKLKYNELSNDIKVFLSFLE
ncbi:hypothetical protein KCM76_19625 [Zooshikella marina]|uniref:hypothetical protein n=1 Tax=Zooshikella ganghwensis TaxID=202772 RepID=UPI001BB0D65A|nr:hypothetical protein [Zooshikella ganghwensis]MBU2708212.1 hypothetical protein [Zooshikella ganghwensis]